METTKRGYMAPAIEDRRPVLGLLGGSGNISECLRETPPSLHFLCDPNFGGSG